MNNYEKIKAMSIDEIAIMILRNWCAENCRWCPHYPYLCMGNRGNDETNCIKYIKQWLESDE